MKIIRIRFLPALIVLVFINDCRQLLILEVFCFIFPPLANFSGVK